jgi:hypothetical protein
MDKTRSFRTFLWRAVLKVLILEVILIALAWLLYQRVSWFERLYFSDILFTMGALVLMIGSFGMMDHPFPTSDGPWRPAPEPAAQPKLTRSQALIRAIEQKSVGLSLVFLGLLTLLMAVILWANNI